MTAQDPKIAWLSDDVIQMTLPSDDTAAASARRFIVQTWPGLDEDTLDDLRLIVTELVTNAQRHGQPEFELHIRVESFAIDLAVLDHGPGEPMIKNAGHSDTSGRGLHIVDSLAVRWGVEPLTGEPGKYVWARLHRDTTSRGAAPGAS